MKIRRILLALVMILPLAACEPVLALNSLATDEELVFEPELVGAWKGYWSESLTWTWTFEKSGDCGYKLTITDPEEIEGGAAIFDVGLVRLGPYLFMDAQPKKVTYKDQRREAGMAVIPSHYFGRVWLEGEKLRIHILDDKWLKKAIAKKRVKLQHVKPERSGIVLTASTAELQRFALQYAEEDEAFSFKFELTRAK